MTVLTDSHRSAILRAREAYLAGLGEAERLRESVQSAFLASVEDARAAGATNQEIGDVLGVSRQRVSQLLKGKDVEK